MKKLSKMKILAAVLILALTLMALVTVEVSNAVDDKSGLEERELYFPSPPDTPRIKYIGSLSSPRDWKLKKSSFFMRLLKRIVGLEDRKSTLVYPYGLATDREGRLFVADSKAQRIHVFDRQKKKYTPIDAPKGEIFLSLIGVDFDSDNNLYVSDSATGKMFVFNKKAKFKRVLGDDEGLFGRPTGIAVDPEERQIYVVETEIGRIDVIDLKGKSLFSFGKRGNGDGEFNRPTQVALHGDRVYVTDTLNARIQVFDKSGNFISKVGSRGLGPGYLDKPKGVAIDSDGNIYVVEAMRDAVQMFNRDGAFLMEFGSTGNGRGEFYLPTAIHIDESDTIYISDTYNRRVQIFKYLKQAGQGPKERSEN